MKSFAIILATGRGSQMKVLTDDRPKCLLELAGKSLLHWQEASFMEAHIKEIHIVKGYKPECLPTCFSNSINMHWQRTNMLYSLACASEYINNIYTDGYTQFIVSYSDIVYSSDHIGTLLTVKADIAITYDIKWLDLWRLRFDKVLDDAEIFREEQGMLCKIGDRARDVSQIGGQYMGLLKMTVQGWEIWNKICEKIDIKTMDMMDF